MAKPQAEGTGWFASPNEIFDREGLSAHEKLVLLFLCRSVGPDGRAWPSYARIAKACGISRRSAIETVRLLVDKQLVSATPRRDDAGDSATNVYRLRFGSRAGATGALGSAMDAPPSADGAPGVVQDVHRGGAPGAPEGHPLKVTHSKDKDLSSSSPSETRKRGAQNGAPRSPRSGKKLDESTSPTHQALAHFSKRFTERFGDQPTFNFGKDGKLAAALIERYTQPRLLELIDRFFETNDPWVQSEGGYTFGVFHACINKLISTAPARAAPRPRFVLSDDTPSEEAHPT